jgi:pimeloyl-ACP methyl ester carboxylesterase
MHPARQPMYTAARPHIHDPLPRLPRKPRRGRRGLRRSATLVVALLCAALVGGALPETATAATPQPRTLQGRFADGATWLIEVPPGWNGTLLLYQHGLVPPGQPNPATDTSDPVSAGFLLDHGFALAGSSFATTGWAVEDGLRDQLHLLDVFEQRIGAPGRTVTWGDSMGGLMAVALAERAPERVDGALSMCGPNAGAVGLWNSYLDVLFTLEALIAPNADIELTDIGDPFGSLTRLQQAMAQAQKTPRGRARIALAASVGNIPGWVDPDEPEPDAGDVATQERNQFRVLNEVTTVLGILERAEFEARAGGNAGSNTGVDYGSLLQRSSGRQEVEQLYRRAGADVTADLATLAAAPRIEAEPAAVDYLERFASFDGHLDGTPVLTLHTVADPLAPVQHEQAYLDTVRAAGQGSMLRRAFVERAGHCLFTPAEKVAALQTVLQRVAHGRWFESTDPARLGARARALGPGLNVALGDDGQVFPVAPAFTAFTPGPFPRPHDLAGAR